MSINQSQFILSTCGTSLLTNQRNQEERTLVNTYANATQRTDIPDSAAATLSMLLEQVAQRLSTADLLDVAKMSAELNALLKLYDGQVPVARDYHLLLCTDTWLGEAAAQLVATWLRQQGCNNVEVRRQKDLQTAQLTAFQLALSDLIQWCEDTLPGYRAAQYHIVFNLTGGFKSVQGFLQTLAMFYADEVVYIFESGTALLHIPRLPIRMDAEDTVRNHLTTFRRLAYDLPVEAVSGIPETMLLRIDQQVTFSPWGQLVWERTKKQLYADAIYPAPSPKLAFGPRFGNSVAGLPPDRRVIVNERIDDLARFLEAGINLRSLDFKPLRGNPKPPATHECDAWADGDARRMFGHFEGEVFVLDLLDRALH